MYMARGVAGCCIVLQYVVLGRSVLQSCASHSSCVYDMYTHIYIYVNEFEGEMHTQLRTTNPEQKMQ